MSEKETITKNQEILFLYDAKLCNPNGDPDNENKPRMDWDSKTNLVSDVRLKRYVRDYLSEHKKLPIFVSKVDGSTVDATDRMEALYREEFGMDSSKDVKEGDITKAISEGKLDVLKLIDVRLFGATIPIKAEKKGSSLTFTGPVQFNWGFSLNEVELNESKTITSSFKGRSTEGDAGTIGKDYRVKYSFIAFHGIVNANRAKFTALNEDDVELLEESLKEAIPLLATRSKIGQEPRFLLRVVLKDGLSHLGDLRDYISLKECEGLSGIEDVILDVSKLNALLDEKKDLIEKIYFWKHPSLKMTDSIKAEV